jgi:hypothetical protein
VTVEYYLIALLLGDVRDDRITNLGTFASLRSCEYAGRTLKEKWDKYAVRLAYECVSAGLPDSVLRGPSPTPPSE